MKKLTNEIFNAVAKVYNLSLQDILQEGKTGSIIEARKMTMYLLNRYTDLSSEEIREALGGCNEEIVKHEIDAVSCSIRAGDSKVLDAFFNCINNIGK